ncbi:MAG: glycosyltransferase [Acidobacteriota bacterium]
MTAKTGSGPRTAVIHDWLNGMRGGEKVLETILEIVPQPTIFTLFHVPGSVSETIERHPIRVSALDRIPGARRHYRQFLPFFSKAVESFDLSGFDLVVSSSHCVAKGAIAPAGVPHLCYCHTPVRYAWDQLDVYFPPGSLVRSVQRAFVRRLREWDRATADRPNRYLANSSAVAGRIRRNYGRDAAVCHPPVDVDYFEGDGAARSDFLLAVGALVPYKRFEWAIEAAAKAGRQLVVVGRGPEEARLRRIAGPSVRFESGVSPERLRDLYRQCAFFVQPGEEDFGIASVEALACGAPIVALARGGASDVVDDGETGVLYSGEGGDALAEAVGRAGSLRFDYTRMRARALRFRPERFIDEFRREIDRLTS